MKNRKIFKKSEIYANGLEKLLKWKSGQKRMTGWFEYQELKMEVRKTFANPDSPENQAAILCECVRKIKLSIPEGSVIAGTQDDAFSPGYALADCDVIYDDSRDRAVSWKGRSDVSHLAGKPIRILYELQDARMDGFAKRTIRHSHRLVKRNCYESKSFRTRTFAGRYCSDCRDEPQNAAPEISCRIWDRTNGIFTETSCR
ncbi:MAG: hypothetical protein IJZ19_06130 [Lentisphaeria bacterium]|nr:hypothetical protein [Lentisphaeria bacterium]